MIRSIVFGLALAATALNPALAADRRPLVIVSGQTQAMPSGDTVPVAAGGTGATTASAARSGLGLGTLATQSAPTGSTQCLQANSSGVVSGTGSACGSGGGGGGVSSIDVSGGTTGLTTSGGPVTTSGTITLAGTLDVDNGGTGQTNYTNGQLLIGNTTGNTLAKSTLTAGSGISVTNGAGSITIAATGGSSWAFSPPTAASFSLVNGGGTNLTLTDDTDAGLLIDSGTTASGINIRMACRTLTDKTQNWQLTVRISDKLTTTATSLVNYGLYGYDSVGGKLVSINELFQSTSSTDFFEVDYWTNTTTFSSAPASFTSKSRGTPEWFRLERSGSNLLYSVGNGKQWIQVLSAGVTAHLANAPDKVCIGINMQRSSGGNAYAMVPYYSLTGPGV